MARDGWRATRCLDEQPGKCENLICLGGLAYLLGSKLDTGFDLHFRYFLCQVFASNSIFRGLQRRTIAEAEEMIDEG